MKLLILSLRNSQESHLCPTPSPSTGQQCYVWALSMVCPSRGSPVSHLRMRDGVVCALIFRKQLTCWGRKQMPSLPGPKAGPDWFRNGHMARFMALRFKATFVSRFGGSLSLLCWISFQNQFCTSVFPQMEAVDRMAVVFRALHPREDNTNM